MAKKRTNIIPIIEDARHPHKYRMLVGMVDCVFADVAQPDQARIVSLNSSYFLKNGGHFVISIKVISLNLTISCLINQLYLFFRQTALIRLPNPKPCLPVR